jgi:hypothetical protein
LTTSREVFAQHERTFQAFYSEGRILAFKMQSSHEVQQVTHLTWSWYQSVGHKKSFLAFLESPRILTSTEKISRSFV